MGLAGGGGGLSLSEGQQWPLAWGLSLGVVDTDRWTHGTEALCAESERNEFREDRSSLSGSNRGDPVWFAEAPVQGSQGGG